MACAKPFIRAYKKQGSLVYMPTPCGYCASCRRDKITMWSDRIGFEMLSKGVSTFLTLTYSDDFLPKDKSVHLEEWQTFHDRLRHKKGVPKYSYFVSSEYGSENYRPHYHICLLGFDWSNPRLYKALYDSWSENGVPKGFMECDFLNPARIRYTVKYISKELRGDCKAEYEELGLLPLFHTMSKGIGKQFFFDNLDTIRKFRGYYVNGKLRPLPRYYADLLRLYEDDNRSDFDKTKKMSALYFNRTSEYWNCYLPPLYKDSVFENTKLLTHLEKVELLQDRNTIG